MTVTVKRPDANPESTTMDGSVRKSQCNQTWNTIRGAAAGCEASPSSVTNCNYVRAGVTACTWSSIRRTALLFDFSCIACTDTKDGATFCFVASAKSVDISADKLSLITSTPASDTNLVNADYNQFGTTKQAADITIGSITVDISGPTFNRFTLNSTGLGNVSLSGISKFGTRITSDNDDCEPCLPGCHTDCCCNQVVMRSADEADSADTRPKMILTHTPLFNSMQGVGQHGAMQPLQIPTEVIPY